MGFSFVIFRKLCGSVILEQGDWREWRERRFRRLEREASRG